MELIFPIEGRGLRWPQIFLLICLDLLSTGITFVSALQLGDYGTTWLVGLALMICSTLCLVISRFRSRLSWSLLLACFALAVTRALGTWADETVLSLPSLAAMVGLMIVLVTAPVFMAATALKVPLWPGTPQKHMEAGGGDLLWLPVVMRPLAITFLFLSYIIVGWGFNWSNRSHPFFGITLSSLIAFACFVPLCYLAVSVSSIEKRMRTADLLSQAADQKDRKVIALGISIFYVWGLTIEWRTTHKYVLWTFLALILFLLTRLFLSLLRLELVEGHRPIMAETAWPRRIFALHVLLLMLFGLIFIELFSYVFH